MVWKRQKHAWAFLASDKEKKSAKTLFFNISGLPSQAADVIKETQTYQNQSCHLIIVLCITIPHGFVYLITLNIKNFSISQNYYLKKIKTQSMFLHHMKGLTN